MARVVLEECLFQTTAVRNMGRKLGWGEAQAIGALALFWAKTRDAGIVEGSAEEIFPLLPTEPHRRDALFRALVDAGFIERRAAGAFAVTGNAEHLALIAKRREAGRKGRAKMALVAKERLAARAKPRAKPKPAKKRTDLVPPKAVRATASAQEANRAAWDAYASAFTARWSVPPTRNARVNACVAQFVQRVGRDDAPRVLEFFVAHNDSAYLRSHHAMTLAVRDAEGLHTQWKRGQPVTSHDIRRMESTVDTADQLRRIGIGEL